MSRRNGANEHQNNVLHWSGNPDRFFNSILSILDDSDKSYILRWANKEAKNVSKNPYCYERDEKRRVVLSDTEEVLRDIADDLVDLVFERLYCTKRMSESFYDDMMEMPYRVLDGLSIYKALSGGIPLSIKFDKETAERFVNEGIEFRPDYWGDDEEDDEDWSDEGDWEDDAPLNSVANFLAQQSNNTSSQSFSDVDELSARRKKRIECSSNVLDFAAFLQKKKQSDNKPTSKEDSSEKPKES